MLRAIKTPARSDLANAQRLIDQINPRKERI